MKQIFLLAFLSISALVSNSQAIYQEMKVERYEVILRSSATTAPGPDKNSPFLLVYLYGTPINGTQATTSVVSFLQKDTLMPPPRYDAASKMIYSFYARNQFESLLSLLKMAIDEKRYNLFSAVNGDVASRVFSADVYTKQRQ